MSRFFSPLDNVHVASPCSADWDSMYGDDRKRFCKECKLNVFNLSGMTREDAERLITNAQGRLCVRFYRRPDGTIITQDCPVGWARVKQRARIYATAMLSMLAAMLTGIFVVSMFKKPTAVMGDIRAVPTPTATPMIEHTMGAIAVQGNYAVEPPRKTADANFEMGKVRALAGDRD